MAKKGGFYATELPVPAKQKADKNPYPGPQVGALSSPTVDENPGAVHGLGTPTAHFGHPGIKGEGSRGYGHVAKLKHGALRLSGHPGAHMIGAKFKPVR